MKFLFWNINRKHLANVVGSLSRENDVDVVMLAENQESSTEILLALNQGGTSAFYYSPSYACEKIILFSKVPHDYILPIRETGRLTIRHLTLPGLSNILLAVLHFPDKGNWDEDSQYAEITKYGELIKETEKSVGHMKTVIVGDFNMNPFEPGIVNAIGLHAVANKAVAKKISRTVQSVEYPFLYNPMWSHFGDKSPEPAGTYYFEQAIHKVYFWNIFDQVLMRPELADHFDNSKLKIIDQFAGQSLLDGNGLPNSRDFSDHLPICFELSL